MDEIELEEVRSHIEVLRWIKERKAELKELEEHTRSEIEAAMGQRENGTLDGVQVVRWSHFKTTRLNQNALKKDHPELVANYLETSESRRFTLLDGSSTNDE